MNESINKIHESMSNIIDKYSCCVCNSFDRYISKEVLEMKGINQYFIRCNFCGSRQSITEYKE